MTFCLAPYLSKTASRAALAYVAIKIVRAIAINMLAMSPDDQISDDEIKDALGEIANMVMGTVKTAIQSDLQHLQVSIPVVVTGMDLQNSLGEGTQKISVTVTTSDNYIIELTLLYRESREKK